MACIIDLWQDSSISIIRVMYSSFFTQLTAEPNSKSVGLDIILYFCMKICW